MLGLKYRFLKPWGQHLPGKVIEPDSAALIEMLVSRGIIEPVKTRRRRKPESSSK